MSRWNFVQAINRTSILQCIIMGVVTGYVGGMIALTTNWYWICLPVVLSSILWLYLIGVILYKENTDA